MNILKIFGIFKPEVLEVPEISNKREELYNLIKSIFPKSAYCQEGLWSWCPFKVDFVFPEVLVYNTEHNQWMTMGIIFHIKTKDNMKETNEILDLCNKNNLCLICIEEESYPLKEDIIKKIEESFSDTIKVIR